MRNLLIALLCGALATAASAQSALSRFAYSHPQMGSSFGLVFYCADSALALRAARAAFEHLDTLNARLSDYLKGSELNRLCARAGDGQFHAVSEDLWQVAVLSKRISRLSRGAFDITAGPYTHRWRRAIRSGEMPPAAELRELGRRVGWRRLELDPQRQRIRLRKPGMQLDLGAIAKGYAADEMLRVLAGFGIACALADGGGDLALGEAPPDSPGWAIELPVGSPGGQAQTLYLARCGIATSGDTYKYFEHQGVRYSHILDPRTGLGMSDRRLVSVIAPSGAEADALATTCSVLKPGAAARLLARLAREARAQGPRPYELRVEFQSETLPRVYLWPSSSSSFLH
jgi:thiamine biosynthesis lipoprotein